MSRSSVVLALVAAVVVTACATKRTLTIRSEPPGAAVRLDHEIVGTTPVTVRFLHYGDRRLTLYLDGYRTRSERVHVGAPWWATFPIDLFTEVLLPFGWEDRHVVHFQLEPGGTEADQPELRRVLERAEVLRRAGPTGPRDLPPVERVQTENERRAGQTTP